MDEIKKTSTENVLGQTEEITSQDIPAGVDRRTCGANGA